MYRFLGMTLEEGKHVCYAIEHVAVPELILRNSKCVREDPKSYQFVIVYPACNRGLVDA